MAPFCHALRRAILAAVIACFAPLVTVAGEGPVVLAFGDSLTAGYDLAPGESVPARLEAELRAKGLNVRVINAGVSGDTTTSALARLDWALARVPGGKPDLVIVEIGANDALRGFEPSLTRRNLDAILGQLTERGIPVLFSGMYAPPNMDEEFGDEFNEIFPELAEAHGVAYDPFFLEGVAANPRLNLPDGMHPNAEGAAVIAARLAPIVAELLTGQ